MFEGFPLVVSLAESPVERSRLQEGLSSVIRQGAAGERQPQLVGRIRVPGSLLVVPWAGDTAALPLTLDQVDHPGEPRVSLPWHRVLQLQPGQKVWGQLGLTEVSGHYRYSRYGEEPNK